MKVMACVMVCVRFIFLKVRKKYWMVKLISNICIRVLVLELNLVSGFRKIELSMSSMFIIFILLKKNC